MDRLLAAEQKAIDYKPTDDGNAPDHRPTNACTKSVAVIFSLLCVLYLSFDFAKDIIALLWDDELLAFATFIEIF